MENFPSINTVMISKNRKKIMPAGDAQRAWFPEMLLELEQKWYPDMTWDEYVDFCSEMTRMRENIWIHMGSNHNGLDQTP